MLHNAVRSNVNTYTDSASHLSVGCYITPNTCLNYSRKRHVHVMFPPNLSLAANTEGIYMYVKLTNK